VITSSYASGNVNGTSSVGGLAGTTSDTVSSSYATGNVNGSEVIGGLVGEQEAVITSSYASGNVNGTSSVGGLAGTTSDTVSSSLSSSYATGNVNGSEAIGGLVGYQTGAINSSYSKGSVNGSEYVGGLIGFQSELINSSYATGRVNGTNDIGGLVGNQFDDTIKRSYATGSVTGKRSVGGLVGDQNGMVNSSYATGSVTGDEFVGGLVGLSRASVNTSYATGVITTSGIASGGIVGYNDSGTVAHAYWNTETTEQSSSAGLPDANGLTTNEMTGTDAESNLDGFDFTNTWRTRVGDYPELLAVPESGGTESVLLNLSTLDIAGQGDSATIGENESREINVTVENIGNISGQFSINLEFNDTTVATTATPEIAPDDNATITFSGETDSLPPGTHSVNVTNELGNYTNGTIEVKEPANFIVDVDADTVGAGNNITAEVNITNTGDVTGTQEITTSDDGTTLNTTTISLDSGESTNITVDRETTADDIGTVIITAASDDADATTQATVTPPAANVSELNISAAGSTAAIGSGDNATITANVSNLGEVAYDFPVTLKLNGSAVRSTTATISPNTNKTVNFTGVTEQLPIDAHDVNVTTPSNHTTGTLTVEQPAVFAVDVDANAVSAGNNISAEVNITNTGDRAGNAAIKTIGDGTTLNTTTVSLDSAASTNITVERETAVADIGTVNLTSTSPDTTATTAVTVTDPEPPNVTAVQRNVTATNDTVQINATFENGSVPIEDARIELVADFTTFTKSVTVETPAGGNADNQTTFDVTGLPADGNYTPKAVAVGPVGQTDMNTTAPVTVDTTLPELQLATTNLTADSNLRIEPSEPVTVSDNGISVVNKTGSDRSPSSDNIPNEEFTESKTVPFDGTVTGDNETFTVSVDATDGVGNTVTQNLTATVTNYTVSEDGTGVVTPTDDTTISVEADASEVDEEKAKTASVQRSSTAPTGTNLNSSQVGAGFVNVSDIGLTESELERATINISLDELDQQAVSSFDNSSLRIFKSEDGDRTYHPVETAYNDDTHTVTATVDGFSQFSVTGVDSTKPSVTNIDIDPGRTVEPTSGPVNISYEYTDSETGINLAETTLTAADVDGNRKTTNVMADTAWIEIDQLTDGESITVELNTTDNAGNSRTKTETISVETASNDDGNNDDGGSSGGGGGGGGGGGLGGGGGGSTQSSPPTFEQIHSTLSLVPAESETNIELTDKNTNDDRLTIKATGTDSVSRIHFNNQELSGQTKITDYGEPPATIKNDIKYSAANDISSVDVTTNGDDEVVDSNINIISLTDIEPEASATEDQSATVELSVPKSAIENPNRISILKEEYIFSEQKTRWVTVETAVSENGEQYVLKGDVNKFSLFAVTEISDGAVSATGAGDDDSKGSNDISPSVMILLVVLVLAVVIAMIRIRR